MIIYLVFEINEFVFHVQRDCFDDVQERLVEFDVFERVRENFVSFFEDEVVIRFYSFQFSLEILEVIKRIVQRNRIVSEKNIKQKFF